MIPADPRGACADCQECNLYANQRLRVAVTPCLLPTLRRAVCNVGAPTIDEWDNPAALSARLLIASTRAELTLNPVPPPPLSLSACLGAVLCTGALQRRESIPTVHCGTPRHLVHPGSL